MFSFSLYTTASVPKSVIESAIAKGQGKSPSGVALEAFTLEVLMPPDVALIIETETDNKIRTMHDLKHVVKNCDGLSSSTQFFFTRRGRSIFAAKQENEPTLSQVLEEAIEHDGVEDVEELPLEAGRPRRFVLWTQPNTLMAPTKALAEKFGLEILESDIIQAANEDTVVDIDTAESAHGLDTLLSSLREYAEVKAIYANIRQGSSITEEEWDKMQRNIDL